MSKGFDVAAAKAVAAQEDEGIVVPVKDERGEPQFVGDVPVTITVAGTYSSVYRRALDAQRDRLMKRRRASTGDELQRQQLEIVAACILAWDGIMSGEKAFPLTKENAIVLLEAAPWIRADVEAAMDDHAGFFKPASSSS